MQLRFFFTWVLAIFIVSAPILDAIHAPLHAQDVDDDDDDDDDPDDDGGDDDDDVADPDEEDPDDDLGDEDVGDDDVGDEDVGDDDVGDEDVGDEDVGDDDVGDDDVGDDDVGDDDVGDDDVGDDDVGDDDVGDDDVGDDDVGDDDVGDDDVGDDDAGEDGADDDDTGDDDTGDDDTGDDDTGDDDVGDDDADDDEAGDEVTGEGADDEGDDDAEESDDDLWEFADIEAEAERVELDERDRIDTDTDGFRYRRGEFVALDLTDAELVQLRDDGFEVIATETLESLSGTVHLLRGPPQLSDEDSLDAIDLVADPDAFGLNHLFDSSAVKTSRKRGGSPPQRSACGCEIGLIDTGVAGDLAMFRHVTLVQRAFNANSPRPRLHGTAVAHLMAGTRPVGTRPTKIFVADIFSGPRATSGSSFALIKALDWMAAQGVPVVNVSLSGPRNPAVASAVKRLADRGHIIVAAAGNDGPAAPPVFPGAYAGVVAVTAVDGANRIYRYANRGNYVDFSARGVAVAAIDARGDLREATGTSFAAPAIAARLAAQLRKPDAAASMQAIRRLEAEARDLGPPGRDATFGVGLIEETK